MANLPKAVHLVADAPEADLEGLRMAVGRPQFSHRRIGRTIYVLHFLSGRVVVAVSAVDREIRFGIEKFAERKKFVEAYIVRVPVAGWPLVTIAKTVAPVIRGNKVAARPFGHGISGVLEEVHHPGMEALDVLRWHEGHGADVEAAAACSHNLQPCILRIHRRCELQRELALFMREGSDGHSL